MVERTKEQEEEEEEEEKGGEHGTTGTISGR